MAELNRQVAITAARIIRQPTMFGKPRQIYRDAIRQAQAEPSTSGSPAVHFRYASRPLSAFRPMGWGNLAAFCMSIVGLPSWVMFRFSNCIVARPAYAATRRIRQMFKTIFVAWFLAGMRNLGAEASFMAWLEWRHLRHQMKLTAPSHPA